MQCISTGSSNLLPDIQSGFRQHHGCTTALINVLSDNIIEASRNGKITVLVILDYSKAFDTINRDLLYSILHYVGFPLNAIELIKIAIRKDKRANIFHPANCSRCAPGIHTRTATVYCLYIQL